MEPSQCPHCGKRIKSGLLSSNNLLSKELTVFIDEFSGSKSGGYCASCKDYLLQQSDLNFRKEIALARQVVSESLVFIPVVTLQQPRGWEYSVVTMVTGQSTTGTGILSEISSSFTDLFGMQSQRYNDKIRSGEELCLAQLRQKAYEAGGNAVIATDIDYAELGGGKGMIMVCASGTAVRITNGNIMGQEWMVKMEKLAKAQEKLKYLFGVKPEYVLSSQIG